MAFYYGNTGGGFFANLPKVTKNLLIINIIVFLASELSKSTLMLENFGLFYPTSPYFHYWQPLTYMFMHGGFFHILFNMYTLVIFGSVVERIIGEKKFLLFYIICGLGAAAFQIGAQYLEMQSYLNGAALGSQKAVQAIGALRATPTVGASGAIYGLLIAYAMLFPDSRMTLLFPPVTLSAKWMVVVFAAIELFSGVAGVATSIAHLAHLGGMAVGWALIRIWKDNGRLFNKNWW